MRTLIGLDLQLQRGGEISLIRESGSLQIFEKRASNGAETGKHPLEQVIIDHSLGLHFLTGGSKDE